MRELDLQNVSIYQVYVSMKIMKQESFFFFFFFILIND